jgi:hypothetical protein
MQVSVLQRLRDNQTRMLCDTAKMYQTIVGSVQAECCYRLYRCSSAQHSWRLQHHSAYLVQYAPLSSKRRVLDYASAAGRQSWLSQ